MMWPPPSNFVPPLALDKTLMGVFSLGKCCFLTSVALCGLLSFVTANVARHRCVGSAALYRTRCKHKVNIFFNLVLLTSLLISLTRFFQNHWASGFYLQWPNIFIWLRHNREGIAFDLCPKHCVPMLQLMLLALSDSRPQTTGRIP